MQSENLQTGILDLHFGAVEFLVVVNDKVRQLEINFSESFDGSREILINVGAVLKNLFFEAVKIVA
jgi:hypothetical protein